jgi:hypothetical protein
MAEETQTTETQPESSATDGGDGHGSRTAVRAAAVAAVTGATALAAKKAFLGGGDRSETRGRTASRRSGADESLFGSMLASGWDAARDSLVPFAEDAAGAAGEYLARHGPDLFRETLVPRFIRGFEQAKRSTGDEAGS